jgi:hypothetical protein
VARGRACDRPPGNEQRLFRPPPREAWQLERRGAETLLLPGAATDPDFAFRFPPAAIARLESLAEVVRFYNTRDVLPTCGPSASRADWGVICWPEPEVADDVNTRELGDLGLTDEEEDPTCYVRTWKAGHVGFRGVDRAPAARSQLSRSPAARDRTTAEAREACPTSIW